MKPKRKKSSAWCFGWLVHGDYDREGWWITDNAGYQNTMIVSLMRVTDGSGQTARLLVVWRFMLEWAKPQGIKSQPPSSLDRIARRVSDSALYEPSFPDNYTDGQVISNMLSGGPQWYFRRIVQCPRRWWQLRQRWKRTGEIWQPNDASEFDVIQLHRKVKIVG